MRATANWHTQLPLDLLNMRQQKQQKMTKKYARTQIHTQIATPCIIQIKFRENELMRIRKRNARKCSQAILCAMKSEFKPCKCNRNGNGEKCIWLLQFEYWMFIVCMVIEKNICWCKCDSVESKMLCIRHTIYLTSMNVAHSNGLASKTEWIIHTLNGE